MTRGGLAALILGAMVVVGLDVAFIGDVDVVHRTISEHQLGPARWIFSSAVVLIAAGSIAIGVSLIRAGVIRPISPGSILLGLWSLGLLALAWFQKTDWSVGDGTEGQIHRLGSLIAFLALPIAVTLIGRSRPGRWSRAAVWGGIASLVWIAGMIVIVLIVAQSGVPWWRAFPLGLVERGLAVLEIGSVFALALIGSSARREAAPARTALRV